MSKLWISVLASMMMLASFGAVAGADEDEKLQDVSAVLQDFVNIPENAIPPALLEQAYGIAIIPSVVKLSFILGGRRGTGVVAVRTKNGKWSNPSFISLTGGSIGWQIGASSTDIILIFKSRRSIDRIARGDITLGADASVAAGPVGRSVSASTNIDFSAEVYSYSRARGLFAGVSLEGAALNISQDANADFYNQPDISALEILGRSSTDNVPPAGEHLMQTLERYLPRPR